MTTATTTEDELLIITDDDVEETSPIEIKQEEPTNDSIVEFWETEISEKNSNDKEEESSIDLNFDFGSDDKEIQVSDIFGDENNTEEIEKNEESVLEETTINDFSFDLGEENNISEEIKTKQEENTILEKDNHIDFWVNLEEIKETSKVQEETEITTDAFSIWEVASTANVIWTSSWDDSASWDDDINSILETTIKKLQARKEGIEKIKKETSLKIEELAAEIKTLQTEVKIHKSEIKEFDKETSKIEENIESLEKMKMK